MDLKMTGVRATTLTPFAYHSLAVAGGTATLPELISDTAFAFALANTLGMLRDAVALPVEADYRADLSRMGYVCSVLTTESPTLLPPLVRRLNLDAEAGYQKKVQDAAKSGNLKEFFLTQEVPQDQVFDGAVFGQDPFALTGERELVVRVGLHRNGMVRLEPYSGVSAVRLNVATGHLFGRTLPVDRYCLHNIQLSPWMSLPEAAEEVYQWK